MPTAQPGHFSFIYIMVDLYVKSSNHDLRVTALTNIFAFADLIDFRGGCATMSKCHHDMIIFNVRNQTEAQTDSHLRRRIVLFPREHRKSTYNTILYSMWRIYRNPDIRTLVGTNEKKLAKLFIVELRQYFEDGELQASVWNNRPHIQGRLIPVLDAQSRRNHRSRRNNRNEDDDDLWETEALDRKIKWTSEELQMLRPTVMKEPSFAAYSVGTSPVGTHFDLLELDDIVDLKNSKTPEKALTVETWANSLESVVTKKAQWVQICRGFGEWVGNEVVINGTRYFYHDYYSKFVGNNEEECQERLQRYRYSLFEKNIYVNGVDSSNGYIFPEEFDENVENDLRTRLKAHEFAAQYLLKIVADESVILKDDMLRVHQPIQYTAAGFNKINFYDTDTRQIMPIYPILVVDPAISMRRKSDNTFIGLGGYDERGVLHLIDAITKKLLPDDLVRETYALLDKWKLNSAWIESGVGYQASLLSIFKNNFDRYRPIVLREIIARAHGNKEDRIKYALEPLLRAGRFAVNLPVLNSTNIRAEMKYFMSGNYFDDALDGTTNIALHAIVPKKKDANTKQNARHLVVNTMYGGCR